VYDPIVNRSDAVVFEDVCFAYGDQVILNNLSFALPAGSTTILLGASGAGMSTIL
jgi:ABC-type multidrug transport system fused ATPase/permease subunit